MERRRRRFTACTAWIALACAAPLAAQPFPEAPPRPPQVNLRVELRQIESTQRQSAGLGVHERSGERDVQQQLLVLNGGRGSLRLAQGRALQWFRVLPGPQGWVWLPASVWVEAGQGFAVQPRWPGGAAPVTVEVTAESGSLDARAAGREGLSRSNLLTTLQLPLGEWVTVAESVDEQQSRGPWPGRSGSGARQLLVQMRVTLP